MSNLLSRLKNGCRCREADCSKSLYSRTRSKSARSTQGVLRDFSQSLPPTKWSLPFCACAQFSRDSIPRVQRLNKHTRKTRVVNSLVKRWPFVEVTIMIIVLNLINIIEIKTENKDWKLPFLFHSICNSVCNPWTCTHDKAKIKE